MGYMPPISQLRKNVSFILQNGHATVTYSRPFLPNVAEIACIHCKPAKPLPKVSIFLSKILGKQLKNIV